MAPWFGTAKVVQNIFKTKEFVVFFCKNLHSTSINHLCRGLISGKNLHFSYYPCDANFTAQASPIPDEAPVINTVFFIAKTLVQIRSLACVLRGALLKKCVNALCVVSTTVNLVTE